MPATVDRGQASKALEVGEGEHTYSSIFHLDAENAVKDEDTLVVRTDVSSALNLALVPVDREGLTVRIVKGQEDPVQGWIPRERHRQVPTPIYEKTGPRPQMFVPLLVPYAAEGDPQAAAELLDAGLPKEEAIGIGVERAGSGDTILYAFDEPRRMTAGGMVAETRLALVRAAPDGTSQVAAMDGKIIEPE